MRGVSAGSGTCAAERKPLVTSIQTDQLDTSWEWLITTVIVTLTLLIVHAVANGWTALWPGHNFYNSPDTAWIGTYPYDPMHLWAGFVIASIALNLNWCRTLKVWSNDRRLHYVLAILVTLVIIQLVSLTWELLEWFTYNRNPTGFIQVNLLDTLWDELANFLGAGLASIVESKIF